MPFRLLGFGDGWRDGAREALTLSVGVCMMIFQASAGSARREVVCEMQTTMQRTRGRQLRQNTIYVVWVKTGGTHSVAKNDK